MNTSSPSNLSVPRTQNPEEQLDSTRATEYGNVPEPVVRNESVVVLKPLKLLVGMVVLGASLSFMPRVIGPVLETMVLKR